LTMTVPENNMSSDLMTVPENKMSSDLIKVRRNAIFWNSY
jgi:hypothetical protein